MPYKLSYGFLVASAVTLSIIGATLVLPIAVYKPSFQGDLTSRKQLIGSILVLICLSGILAVFSPEKCSKTFHNRRKGKPSALTVEGLGSYLVRAQIRGHHPNCGSFDAHLICLNGRVLCAACTGLFFGGVLVLLGTAFYFFLEADFLGKLGLWGVLVGQIGVVLGFFQFRFKGFIRSFLNAFFVVACFLMLVGADALAENLLVDLYVTCLITFWLFTRILISKWDHSLICRRCRLPCELVFAA